MAIIYKNTGRTCDILIYSSEQSYHCPRSSNLQHRKDNIRYVAMFEIRILLRYVEKMSNPNREHAFLCRFAGTENPCAALIRTKITCL